MACRRSLALSLLFVWLLAACLGPPNGTATNPFAPAHSIVQAWWPQEEKAVISGDPSSLGDLYRGPALTVAVGEMTVAQLKGARPKYSRPFRGSIIFGPSDPIKAGWFLAIVQYAPIDQDGRAQQLTMTFPGLLFARADGIWKADVANIQAPIPHPALGSGDAIVSKPLGDEHYIMAAAEIAAAYSAYLNTLSSGQVGNVVFPTGLNSYAGQVTRLQWPPGSIATTRFSFDVDKADVAAYSITSGLTKVPEVVLFVLTRTVTVKPRPGCLVRRPNDEWSDIVPAGSYRQVTLSSELVVAASVPLNDGDTSQGRKVIDIGGSISDTSAAGVSC